MSERPVISTPALFVDLDETLVKSRCVLQNEVARYEDAGWKQLTVWDTRRDERVYYMTRARPCAARFMEVLRCTRPTFILTTGGEAFQTRVCEAHGIESDELFGSESLSTREEPEALYWRIPLTKCPILLDDLRPEQAGCDAKLRALQGLLPYGAADEPSAEWHVQVNAWLPTLKEPLDDDRELHRLLDATFDRLEKAERMMRVTENSKHAKGSTLVV